MPDFEKTISNLIELNDAIQRRVDDADDAYGFVAINLKYFETIKDAIVLLKTREPRVLSLEEMRALNQYAIVWYENINTEGALPRIVNYVSDYGVHFTDGAIWRFDADRYGSVWRCWTAKPTDEQREAEAWS